LRFLPDPKIDTNKRTITPVHFINLNLYPVTNPAPETRSEALTIWEM